MAEEEMKSRNPYRVVIALFVVLLIFLLPIMAVGWLESRNPFDWEIEWERYRNVVQSISMLLSLEIFYRLYSTENKRKSLFFHSSRRDTVVFFIAVIVLLVIVNVAAEVTGGISLLLLLLGVIVYWGILRLLGSEEIKKELWFFKSRDPG